MKTIQIGIRIDNELLKQYKALEKKQKRKYTEIMRKALSKYIETLK